MPKRYYFEAKSPLGQKIHITKSYWNYIVKKKHPEIKNQKLVAIETIKNPDIIKRSRVNTKIFLYYLKIRNKYYCIVSKHLNSEGFVITAYLTKKLAKGEIIWQKAKR